MSRVAKKPVVIPAGTELKIDGQQVSVKGAKGADTIVLHDWVTVEQGDGEVTIKAVRNDKQAVMMAGTMRSLLNNLVTGCTAGFERKLKLIGVGYRAAAKGNSVSLTLGFSHPVDYEVPEGITVETPSQTEIVVRGIDKQKVGQTAANIRAYRPPEPYKGKGVRYEDEYVAMKEAKKK